MARRLPPLNALRAFEVAARHLSFTKAASELNVTQAAVSHQVKGLEEQLGLTLFRRFNRRLALTPEGQALLPPLSDAFETMANAVERLQRADRKGQLKISCLSSFATKWLLPRMPRFRATHPDIDVLVSAMNELVDFAVDDIDLAIRYGQGQYPGLKVWKMMDDEIMPLCSPALMKGPKALRKPDDLRHHTLIHDDLTGPIMRLTWENWLKTAGVAGIDARRGPGYSDSAMVLQAAVEGQGVALGRRSLAAVDLAGGTLVSPFGPNLPTTAAYYIVTPEENAERAKVKAFREWLLAEAEELATITPVHARQSRRA